MGVNFSNGVNFLRKWELTSLRLEELTESRKHGINGITGSAG